MITARAFGFTILPLAVLTASAVISCDGATSDENGANSAASTSTAPIACSATALGVVQSFDIFVTRDLTQNNTDCGGGVAAGGTATLTSYSAGSQLPQAATRIDLLVGGNLSFNGGSVPNGAALYGGTATLSGTSFFGGIMQGTSPISFSAEATSLAAASAAIGAIAPNGTETNSYGSITLTGTSSGVNVFAVSGTDLAAANGLTITAPAGSTAIVNVSGTTASAQNFGFAFNGVTRENTLFNFYQATTLTLSGIGFDGSILAPLAAVSFSNGQLNGQIFAASLSGTGEVEHDPFAGCIPTTPAPDAGTPAVDAGTPATDAGTPVTDAGHPVQDAGTPVTDAGTPVTDAGTPVTDAGTPVTDAGHPVTDAGTPPTDAGTPPPVDAGTSQPDAGSICSTGAWTQLSNSGTMEGNLKVSPGDTLRAGYDLTVPGCNTSLEAEVADAVVTVEVTCANGTNTYLPIPLPTETFNITSSAWYPSGTQSSSSVWQGEITVPSTLCGGKPGYAPKGATFTGRLSSTKSESFNVRFHYQSVSCGTSGSWSSTECASTTCGCGP
jgi:choice-of-anchor A domain-containing protein